jgi:hypothetical protein
VQLAAILPSANIKEEIAEAGHFHMMSKMTQATMSFIGLSLLYQAGGASGPQLLFVAALLLIGAGSLAVGIVSVALIWKKSGQDCRQVAGHSTGRNWRK